MFCRRQVLVFLMFIPVQPAHQRRCQAQQGGKIQADFDSFAGGQAGFHIPGQLHGAQAADAVVGKQHFSGGGLDRPAVVIQGEIGRHPQAV